MAAALPADRVVLFRHWIDRHLFTLFAVTGSMAVFFFVPQVHNVLFQLPWLAFFTDFDVSAGLFVLYVLALGVFYLALAFVVVPESEKVDTAVITDPKTPRMPAILIIRLQPSRLHRLAECLVWIVEWRPARPELDASVTPPATMLHGDSRGCVMGFCMVLLALLLGAAGFYWYALLSFFVTCWLFSIPDDVPARVPRLGFFRNMLGRLLFILIVTNALGELLWRLAGNRPDVFSYRIYTIWASSHLLFETIIAARILDVWHCHSRWPIRPLSLVVLILLLALGGSSVVGTNRPEEDEEKLVANLTENWFGHLEERLDHLSEGPAIVVAASGGGSRAALFTALVLEGLTDMNTPSAPAPGPHHTGKIADQVVLISSVSGGSLATAYHAHRDRANPTVREWQNSLKKPIVREMRLAARRYHQHYEQEAKRAQGYSKQLAVFQQVRDECREMPDGLPADVPWLLSSTFIDEMSTDFMAPLLRGARPLVWDTHRGQRVAKFWEDRFGWQGIDTHTGLGKNRPLLLFNATDAEHGVRVTIGFPALPPGVLGSPTCSVTDLNPAYRVSLAEAVRLSANFPWIFEVARLNPHSHRGLALDRGTRQPRPPRGHPDDRSTGEEMIVLDGGMVDNTGLDTISRLLHRLLYLADPDNDAPPLLRQRCSRIVERLQTRGILLLEIDSGARMSPSGWLAKRYHHLFEPLQSLKAVRHARAQSVKSDRLTSMLFAGPEAFGEGGQARNLAGRFYGYSVRLQCNHLDKVMTSWALGPDDKAKILVQFLLEWRIQTPELTGRFVSLKERQRLLEARNALEEGGKRKEAQAVERKLRAQTEKGRTTQRKLDSEAKRREQVYQMDE